MSDTIAVDVKLVSVEDAELNLESHVGNLQALRKNPHVIDADFEQDLAVSCWYITLMVISIMPLPETCARSAEIVWKRLREQKLPGGQVTLSRTFNQIQVF